MIETLYIEQEVMAHPTTQRLRQRFARATVIPCDHYGEVFNPKGQNFRLQKARPAMILARKRDGHVLPTPPGYGIGGNANYYFSHMLNCLYDCRYCFLQGMYRSANFVYFVNDDDFVQAIDRTLQAHAGPPVECTELDQAGAQQEPKVTFFSGYDCDSLALEDVTHFATRFVPVFRERPQALLELRTKSVAVKSLLKQPACPNVVVAFSLTPSAIAQQVEHGAAPVPSRIAAMTKLANAGWPIGLRFDPLIWAPNFEDQYSKLFDDVFAAVPAASIHSVTLGPLRFPKAMFRTIQSMYPNEPLFAQPLFSPRGGMMTVPAELEQRMHAFCSRMLEQRVAPERFFRCLPDPLAAATTVPKTTVAPATQPKKQGASP